MKRFFVFLIFAIAGINLSDYATAQQRVSVTITNSSDNVAKGKMPPRWLLNRVTPAQYDTLVVLNKLCSVDYSMLKGYNVTPSDIAKVMKQANEYIRKALDNNDGVIPHVGWKTAQIITVNPWSNKVDKGLKKVEYMIYSSIDGYDVHLLLRTTLQRNRQTGGYHSVAYEVIPYSIQGIPIKVSRTCVSKDGSNPVDNLEIGKDGKSPCYIVDTTINFTDPLGNKHFEKINISLWLTLNR